MGEPSTTGSGAGSDLTRNPRYISILAVAAGLILVIGWLLKPQESSTDAPVSAPSQVELSRLPTMTVRRDLEDMSEFFAELGEELSSTVVRLGSVRRSGVIWSADRVVTARVGWRFPAAVTVGAGGVEVGAYTAVSGPHLPIAALRTPELAGDVPPQARPLETLSPGEWVLAAWQGDSRHGSAPGTFLGVGRRECGEHRLDELATSVPIRPEMLGGGIFDLDGNLLAVLLRCDGEPVAVTVEGVAMLLERGGSHDSRLRTRWGLQVEVLTSAEAFHFGLGNGLLVRQLWERYPGEAAGLRPGDVLLALDGTPLQDLDALRILDADAAPGQEAFSLELRRGLETLTVSLPARGLDTRLDVEMPDATGLVWEEAKLGYPVASVLPGTRAADAGVAPGDRLLRVDHQTPESLNAVRELLSVEGGGPAFLELSRDGRRWGVLLP